MHPFINTQKVYEFWILLKIVSDVLQILGAYKQASKSWGVDSRRNWCLRNTTTYA